MCPAICCTHIDTLNCINMSQVKVMTIDLDTYDLPDIISVVRSSAGLIGVHGSLLAVAMFLPQGSILVELFPYAVNPDHYTPYKTLCHVPGMMIAYRSWANGKRIDSLPHPDWLPEFGGMHHLPLKEQTKIIMQVCCSIYFFVLPNIIMLVCFLCSCQY